MAGTQDPGTVSTRLQRVAELARKAPGRAFTSLAHHIDIEWLREAYVRTRKDGATGVDHLTAEQYATNLECNLRSLLERFKAGTYKAPPVRRVLIPKADGRTRPIGVPTFEDKVLQRAVAMLLEAVYEQDFLNCSYGFRPRRSAHQALETLWKSLMDMRGGWVLEVDIEGFFDSLDHGFLGRFLDQRVRDGVLRRSIGKWLQAGVLDGGVLVRVDTGTPQGGVISPLLANVFLHEVMDTWFETTVKPRLRARVDLVRYADDLVMVFTREDDARRVAEVLPKRFGKYGLTLHPEKTRLVRFCRPWWRAGENDPNGAGLRPGTFDFLGFTHFWGCSRKGRWVVTRKTAGKRFRRALKAVADWCRRNLHRTVAEQHKALAQKLEGHFQYYGITGNWDMLNRFVHAVERLWRYWLNRRSQRRRMPWDRFKVFLERCPLPKVHVAHSALAGAASS